MNLPDLHINEALRQREFPVCADKVYLAHAGVSPVPACVACAVQETADAAALDDQEEGLGDLLRTNVSGGNLLENAEVQQLVADLLDDEDGPPEAPVPVKTPLLLLRGHSELTA